MEANGCKKEAIVIFVYPLISKKPLNKRYFVFENMIHIYAKFIDNIIDFLYWTCYSGLVDKIILIVFVK